MTEPLEPAAAPDVTPEPPDPAAEGPRVASVIEAVLFASDEPLSVTKLAGVVQQTARQVRAIIDTLNAAYADRGHAFRIEALAGGYQMLTLPIYDTWLRQLVKVRGDSRLSPAALEALAIVAYKQPVIRADIEAIRGVASGEILRTLMAKGLVKIVGRAEILGRPMLYGTTKRFLEVFGLNTLKDLPSVEELKRPREMEASAPDPGPTGADPIRQTDPESQAQDTPVAPEPPEPPDEV